MADRQRPGAHGFGILCIVSPECVHFLASQVDGRLAVEADGCYPSAFTRTSAPLLRNGRNEIRAPEPANDGV